MEYEIVNHYPSLIQNWIFPKVGLENLFQNTNNSFRDSITKHLLYQGKGGDFILHHYAGSVGYSVANWLDKNKDPINEDTAGLYAKASNPLVAELFEAYNPDGMRQLLLLYFDRKQGILFLI